MIPSPRNATRSIAAMRRAAYRRLVGLALAAAARRLDPEALAGGERSHRLGWQLLSVEQVAASRSGLATARTPRVVAAPLRAQRVLHLLERLDLPDHAVAAPMPARPAGAAARGVLDRAEPELALQRLAGGVGRVAHG